MMMAIRMMMMMKKEYGNDHLMITIIVISLGCQPTRLGGEEPKQTRLSLLPLDVLLLLK